MKSKQFLENQQFGGTTTSGPVEQNPPNSLEIEGFAFQKASKV